MRPGEWPPVLLLQAQIFLIIAVLLIAKPVGNALFLNRFGAESLPYAYILTAVVAAVISSAYAAAMKYFSVLRVNLWSLGICILLLLTFVLIGLPLLLALAVWLIVRCVKGFKALQEKRAPDNLEIWLI